MMFTINREHNIPSWVETHVDIVNYVLVRNLQRTNHTAAAELLNQGTIQVTNVHNIDGYNPIGYINHNVQTIMRYTLRLVPLIGMLYYLYHTLNLRLFEE